MTGEHIVRVIADYIGWTANHDGRDYWNAFDGWGVEREALQSLDDLRPVIERVAGDIEIDFDLGSSLMLSAKASDMRGIHGAIKLLLLPPRTIARCLAEAIEESKGVGGGE